MLRQWKISVLSGAYAIPTTTTNVRQPVTSYVRPVVTVAPLARVSSWRHKLYCLEDVFVTSDDHMAMLNGGFDFQHRVLIIVFHRNHSSKMHRFWNGSVRQTERDRWTDRRTAVSLNASPLWWDPLCMICAKSTNVRHHYCHRRLHHQSELEYIMHN